MTEKTPTPAQPVTLYEDADKTNLSREVAPRASNRFSLKALRAALYLEHMGKMENPDGYSHVKGYCGDLITFYLRIQDEQIVDITFTTDGCDATIASGEMLASMAKGIPLAEAGKVTPQDLLAALESMPQGHVHCTELAVSTLRSAIRNYREKGS